MGCNVVAKLGLIWKYYFERSALSSVVLKFYSIDFGINFGDKSAMKLKTRILKPLK